MSNGIWTPGQRPPGQIEVQCGEGPQGSALMIKGLGLVLQADGTIIIGPMAFESLEGFADVVRNTIGQMRAQKEAQAAMAAKANGDGGVVLALP